MSTVEYNGLFQVDVKQKKPGFVIVHVRSTTKLCLGQVVIIVLGQVVTTVTTLGRLAPMAQPASCGLTMTEGTKRI